MRIAILCETSGALRERFHDAGHDVYSCDVLPCDNPRHESAAKHYEGDCFDFLGEMGEFDLIVAHPPCTALCVSGNSTYAEGMRKHQFRLDAMKWTVRLWEKCKRLSPRVCFENPVGVLSRTSMGSASQYVQPYEFGHPESKKTGLWLHGLPVLVETDNVKDEYDRLLRSQRQRIHYLSPSEDRSKIRSKTYPGIAEAIVSQWGGLS